jgi:hypothetical protein
VPPANDPEPAQFADIPDPLALTQAVKAGAYSLGAKASGPTRDALRRRRRTLFLASCVWLLGLLVAVGVRRDFAALAPSQMLWLQGLPLLGALGCVYMALSGGTLGLGPKPLLLVSTLAGALIVPVALSFALLGQDGGAAGLREHATCFGMAFGGAFPPLLMLALALPHSFVARPRLRSALLGVAAGLGGALLANLHCSISSRLHVGFAHHTPMLVLALLAALWLGRKLRI